MSLEDEVNRLCVLGGLLYQVPQSLPVPRPRRVIYGSVGIKSLLSRSGGWSTQERIRIEELRVELDYFMDGRRIDLRPLLSLNEYAHMAVLDPPADEVWEFRSVDPKPAMRVFGSFAARDKFIALTWAWRKDL